MQSDELSVAILCWKMDMILVENVNERTCYKALVVMNWMRTNWSGYWCIEDRLKSKLRTRAKTDEDVISCLVESHETVTLRFQRRERILRSTATEREENCVE